MERFARHELIPGWSQPALAGATVVVVGVGALGNEVARLLAMAGVGGLVVCDPDVVEVSNLSRTVLFRERDVGRPKVHAAAETLRDLAPHTRVDPRPLPFQSGVGLAELRDASLVVSCLDSRRARVQLAERCTRTRVGMLDGGTHPWGGEVRYYPPGGPCYACGLTEDDRRVDDDPRTCSGPVPDVGASAPSSALVGAWLSLFAVRVLLGLSVPDRTLRIGGDDGTTRLVEQVPDGTCRHEPLPDAVEPLPLGGDATVGDLLALLGPDAVVPTWERFWLADEPGRTSSVVNRAPPKTRLRDIGIAPREILAVMQPDGIRYVELAGQRSPTQERIG